MSAFERQIEHRIQRFVGPVRPVDDLVIFDAVVATSRPQGWSVSMWAAVRFVAAAFIVVLFGGFLLAGVLTTQQGDDVLPAAVTESPSPMTTQELLSGMVTKEVEPGIFRVDHDGVRDLSPAGNHYLDVGRNGDIWLASYSGDLARLGVAETHGWQLSQDEYLLDLEVAPDGRVWVVTLNEEGSSLRSLDGEAWTTHTTTDTAGFFGDVEIAPDGVIWAVLSDRVLGYLDTDGSMWQTVEMPVLVRSAFMDLDNELDFVATESGVWVPYRLGVWHYADGTWEQIFYRDPETGAMPEGVFWGIGPGSTGDGETLYRHDQTGWRQWSLTEDHMLASWGQSPYGVAPDGSFWAAWPGRGALGTPHLLGVNRFDGWAWERYLPGMSVWPFGMDIAPDGSVWLIAWEDEGVVDDQGRGADAHLYVITPKAVPAARAPVPSAGCGISDVEAGTLHGQSLVVDGDERQWSLYVPEAHDGIDPVPLWVQLHGNQGADVTAVALIASAAEKHGFVVVGPNGHHGNPRWLWHKEDDDVDLTRANPDVAFVEALVDHLGETLCLDLARVYAVGENQGGYAVTGLACVLEDRLAAVATVSGMLDLGERCELERPVPLLNVHSRNDTYALFDGGSGDHPAGLPLSGDGEPMLFGEHPIVKTYQSASIPTRMAGIAVRNGCQPEPIVEAIGDDLERWTWSCPPGAEVELVTHGGGYWWPMGEPVSIEERIWEFFEQHPMPE